VFSHGALSAARPAKTTKSLSLAELNAQSPEGEFALQTNTRSENFSSCEHPLQSAFW
jgi:hypothetical protein